MKFVLQTTDLNEGMVHNFTVSHNIHPPNSNQNCIKHTSHDRGRNCELMSYGPSLIKIKCSIHIGIMVVRRL